MHTQTFLLLEEPLTPKSYLDELIHSYPYDIDPALVYTLLMKHPYPHPALLMFIDHARHIRKYMLCTKNGEAHCLHDLIQTMCCLSQRNQHVLHTHQFQIDAEYHMSTTPIHHPYAHLPLEQIPVIDAIHMHQYARIDEPTHISPHVITKSDQFPFQALSISAQEYLAVAIQVYDMKGILFLPKHAAWMICAISTLYQITQPAVHHDFICMYGVCMPEEKNILYYDQANACYLGCSMKPTQETSVVECSQMIQALYCLRNLGKQDLTISASMISRSTSKQDVGILICGEELSGKSEVLNALMELFHEDHITKVFENFGTLHLLDDTISATGSQIGACIHGTALSKKHIYDILSSSVLVQEGKDTSYFLTPFTTYEETCRFHRVNIVCMLDASSEGTKATLLSAPEEALHGLQATCLIDDPVIQMQFNQLAESFINTMFLNAVIMLKVPMRPRHRSRLHHIQRIACDLYEWIQAM